MADIRIKDLATTASSAASDDFMALDGATNGTRKMSAANPSVTTLTTSGVIAPGGSVHGANGSAANPSFAFLSNQNTGLYRIGLDNIGVAANGAKVLDIATTGLTVTGALGASSLTAPASTNLTLAGGSSGASLVLGQGANGGATITTVGSGVLTATGGNIEITTAAKTFFQSSSQSKFGDASGVITGGSGIDTAIGYFSGGKLIFGITGGVEMARLTDTGNLLIGTTSSTGLTGAGGLKIASTTAGSSGAGALVVQGGISAGNTGSAASYFGGAVTAAGLVTAGQAANVSATNSLLAKGYAVGGYGDYGSILLSASAANTSGARQFLVTNAHNATGFAIIRSTNATTPPTLDTNGVVSSGTVDFAISNAGAATFAGAVTVTGALKLGNAYVAGVVVGTGSITIQDSTGTSYRIPVLV